MGLDKEYVVEGTFGKTTDTYDSEGQTVQKCEQSMLSTLNNDLIHTQLKTFLGKQIQTVPAYSAIKVHGQKLYSQARQGTINLTTLPKREIFIREIELLEFQKTTDTTPPKAKIRVSCSKGTYIRSLVHDLGQKLGTGAYVSSLIRTRIGNYDVENALTVEEFERKWKNGEIQPTTE